MRSRSAFFIIALLFSLTNHSWATDTLEVQPVTHHVYAIVGELGDRSAENLGNNATFGVIVTTKGVILIDPGATYSGAHAIDEKIKSLTDQPVKVVINTGGQDHRWQGNGYFKQTYNAQIIASRDAVADQTTRMSLQQTALASRVGQAEVSATEPVYADTRFDDFYTFILGDVTVELHHGGAAHTPGDSFVWLPKQSVMFSGDLAYVDRMLGVLDVSNSRNWIDVFQHMMTFQPRYFVPGHGPVTTLDRAQQDTLNYLTELRGKVRAFLDDGGDITDIGEVTLDDYARLQNFDTLHGRNAQQVYTEMEWE